MDRFLFTVFLTLLFLFCFLDKSVCDWTRESLMEELNDDYAINADLLSSLPSNFELLYPKQVHSGEELDTLSTKDENNHKKNAHFQHTSFLLNVYNRKLRLKVDLNRDLLIKGLQQKRHVDKHTQMITETFHSIYNESIWENSSGPVEHCYYQGKVKRASQSRVALSTCSGLRGIIHIDPVTTYSILPLQVKDTNLSGHAHVIYETDPSEGHNCGVSTGFWRPLKTQHYGEYLRKLKIMKTHAMDMDLWGEEKHLDLGIVLDHSMFNRLNSNYTKAIDYAIQLANTIDLHLEELQIQVHLVLVEVWNMREQFPVEQNTRSTMHNFLSYWGTTPKPLPLDSIHFVTAKKFESNEVGTAIPDSVCSDRALSIGVDWNALNMETGASVATHMIAHTMGIQPDTGSCCNGAHNCFMSEAALQGGAIHEFSNCSREQFMKSIMNGLVNCLFDGHFDDSYSQSCGNGIQERGEECDCKTLENCTLVDPCCDHTTCLLKPWATCRNGHCCNNCTIVKKEELCRLPSNECDVAEYCNGLSGECPEDDFVQDGQSCHGNQAYCYQGECNTYHQQCFKIWGKDARPSSEPCFTKLNPGGTSHGHCGFDQSIFRKCDSDNIHCGLLQCADGEEKPLTKQEHVTFKFTSEKESYECKSVNVHESDEIGMVQNGTKCGAGHMCLGQECVPVTTVILGHCPHDQLNNTCSGHGVCTNKYKCFCDRGYYGDACELFKEATTTTMTSTTPVQVASTKPSLPGYVIIDDNSEEDLMHNDSTALPLPVPNKGKVSTIWLIIVLVSVSSGACLLMGFCSLCYRRRTPSHQMSPKMNKKLKWYQRMLPYNRKSAASAASSEDAISRIISFGNMPSYRMEKIKASRRSIHSSDCGSEHGSVNSSMNRNSHEIRPVLGLASLAKEPERSILKKNPLPGTSSSMDSLSDDGTSLPLLHQPDASYRRNFRDAATQDEPFDPLDTHYTVHKPGCSDSQDESESSLDKKDFTPTDEEVDSDREHWKALELSAITEENSQSLDNTPTSPTGSNHSSNCSIGSKRSNTSAGSGARARRLKNLEEILEQIDKQAHALVNLPENESVLSSGLSSASNTPAAKRKSKRRIPDDSFKVKGSEELVGGDPGRESSTSPLLPSSSSPSSSSIPTAHSSPHTQSPVWRRKSDHLPGSVPSKVNDSAENVSTCRDHIVSPPPQYSATDYTALPSNSTSSNRSLNVLSCHQEGGSASNLSAPYRNSKNNISSTSPIMSRSLPPPSTAQSPDDNLGVPYPDGPPPPYSWSPVDLPRNQPHLNRLPPYAQLDDYAFHQASLTPDGQSTSEGYYSDRPELDDALPASHLPAPPRMNILSPGTILSSSTSSSDESLCVNRRHSYILAKEHDANVDV